MIYCRTCKASFLVTTYGSGSCDCLLDVSASRDIADYVVVA